MYKLPITKIIVGAFLIPWWDRKHYSRALAYPTLLLVSILAAWTFISQNDAITIGWLFIVLYAFGFSVFAVACHRLILIDQHKHGAEYGLKPSMREFRFLLWLIAIYILFSVSQIIPLTIIMNVFSESLVGATPSTDAGKQSSFYLSEHYELAEFIASIPALYILGRLSLVLPATAIDKASNLKQSWEYTKNNGLRMFVVVGILPWSISAAIGILWREDPTLIEQGTLGLIMYIGMAIEIFALSLAYKDICSNKANHSDAHHI